MDITRIALQIMMMLGIALIGLWLRHKDVMDQPVITGINTIVLKIAMPALTLMAVQKERSQEALAAFTNILIWGFLLIALSCLALYFAVRKWLPEDRIAVFSGLSTMPNAGFVGIPIVQALYGAEGVLLLSAFIIAFNTAQWTVGLMTFSSGKFRLRDAVLNPGVISAAAALLMFYLDIRLPDPFFSMCGQLGALTTPLAMLLAGARLYEFRLSALKDLSLWGAMAARLIVIPLISYLVLMALQISGMSLNILVLGMAMPAATAGLMFAERYKKDSAYAALGVSLSLILCLATIPLLMGALGL